MLRGLYTAAAGMATQQRKHDVSTNNIANLNTPGFKQTHAISRSFPDILISLVREQPGQPNTRTIGRINTGVFAEENLSVFQQGDMQETNNPFDFALMSNIQVPGVQFDASGKAVTPDGQRIHQPQAFFTVQNENGEARYTRSGKFTVNEVGQLVTAEGYQLLDQNGQPVTFVDPDNPDLYQNLNIKVTSKGQLINETTGQPLPIALLISRIDDPNQLIREGYSTYRLDEDVANLARPIDPEDNVEIRQGYIERSNVDATQSMVDVMSALRAYEANQKVVQAYDKSLDKAVNEVGRV